MHAEIKYEALENDTPHLGVAAYDKGITSRNVSIAGIIVGYLFGCTCIIMGALCRLQLLPSSLGISAEGNVLLNITIPFLREAVLFFINVILVKFTVGAAGSAHETALRWKLASENDVQTGEIRLEFNSNLRFLKSSYNWWSANGLVANTVMAVTLAITYASSSMLLLNVTDTQTDGVRHNTVLSSVALIILGIVVLIQVTISTIAICTTEILSWSQSPLDTAAALVASHRLVRRPGRCMHSLYDRCTRTQPLKPRARQESAWKSHPQFRRFTMYIWMLVAAGYYWCLIISGMVLSGTQGSTASAMQFQWTGEAPVAGVLWGMGILLGFQGGIVTTGVTAAQMLVGLTRDEYVWKALDRREDPTALSATVRKRWLARIRKLTVFKMFFLNWQTFVIHMAEPIIHWLFGLAIRVDAVAGFQVRPLPILYITVLATLGVILITMVGHFTPAHTIPSTYGHLQTIVDLVDEWHFPTMYWGNKWITGESSMAIGHAGTSDEPLPEIEKNRLYGGVCCLNPWWTVTVSPVSLATNGTLPIQSI
ncbi:hypothetical protein NEOLEDRAFT_1176600 [Neolentinus lepideus HHB14362 ss-1]|uniref:Uncharacterized protein n=1 Tax=Neolentinus lepideus HHB14362 ss-1 TaxID=1314782 RepID=A0A165U3H2_9AGAM|nr:hypothetical protein NEOLEDRAFT_1176600 [Neolentinus lepideus HHB14362 ss-1]